MAMGSGRDSDLQWSSLAASVSGYVEEKSIHHPNSRIVEDIGHH
jgi:hypothetical protein